MLFKAGGVLVRHKCRHAAASETAAESPTKCSDGKHAFSLSHHPFSIP